MLIHVEVLDFLGSHEQHVGLSFLFVLVTVLLLHLFDLVLLLLSQGLLLSLGLLLLLLLFPGLGLSSLFLLLVPLKGLLRVDRCLQVLLSIVDELGLLEGSSTDTAHDRESGHALVELRDVRLRLRIIHRIVSLPLSGALPYLDNAQFLLHELGKDTSGV